MNQATPSSLRRYVKFFPLLLLAPLLLGFGPCTPTTPPPSGGAITGAAVKGAVEAVLGQVLTEQPLSDEDKAAGGVALYGFGGSEQVTVAVYDTAAHAAQGLVDLGSPAEGFVFKNVLVYYVPPVDGGTDHRGVIESAVKGL